MIRELQVVLNKNINAMYKAGEALVTGMGVVIDHTTKTANLPAAETADEIYFVNKERIPTGLYAGMTDLSDYDEHYTNIATGEPVKLIKPLAGERYGVDQFDEDIEEDDRLAVDDKGIWVKAGAGIKSVYVCAGTQNDAGNTLAIIAVNDTAAANA